MEKIIFIIVILISLFLSKNTSYGQNEDDGKNKKTRTTKEKVVRGDTTFVVTKIETKTVVTRVNKSKTKTPKKKKVKELVVRPSKEKLEKPPKIKKEKEIYIATSKIKEPTEIDIRIRPKPKFQDQVNNLVDKHFMKHKNLKKKDYEWLLQNFP
jgi:hypothetical protein